MKAVLSMAILSLGLVRGLEVSSRELQSIGQCANIVCRDSDKLFCNRVPVKFHNNDIFNCCNDPFCEVCHPNGCDQCCDDTMKADYNTPCKPCCEYDENCTRCTDFVGCQQCKPGCTLEYVDVSETIFSIYPTTTQRLQKCICGNPPPPPPSPTPVIPSPPPVIPSPPPVVPSPPPVVPSPPPVVPSPPPVVPSPPPVVPSPPPVVPSPPPVVPSPPPVVPSPPPVVPSPPPPSDCGPGPCVKEFSEFCSNPNYQFNTPDAYDCCKDDHCKICHSPGCNQCCPGYFKADYSSPCMPDCLYDPNATTCTDYIGSQQCMAGYKIHDVLARTTCFAGYVDNAKKMQQCVKD